MTTKIFYESGFVGTQLAHPNGKKLQVDFPCMMHQDARQGFIVLTREDAEKLGLELLKWVHGNLFPPQEIYMQDRKKGFQISADCPRCQLEIDLFYFNKRSW